jgi:elongator complex protein 3
MASGDQPNLRQQLQIQLKKRGHTCPCIRCREIKLNKLPDKLIYRIREYNASEGIEYFISCEDVSGQTLCGFLRLRLNETWTAFIRELHVYGKLQKVSEQSNQTQHKGIGKKLMYIAYQLCKLKKKKEIRVIAGEGTKRYYEKLCYYESEHGYMMMKI